MRNKDGTIEARRNRPKRRNKFSESTMKIVNYTMVKFLLILEIAAQTFANERFSVIQGRESTPRTEAFFLRFPILAEAARGERKRPHRGGLFGFYVIGRCQV
jgi:hypothetical protein